MQCPECLHEVPENSKFCNLCACDLSAPINADTKTHDVPPSYTPKFLADQILTSKSSLTGERKLVTVLFADVANYTPISEKLDPEDVHQIMDGCFKILMDEIHAYKGRINQFTGDGVMALFGAPIALEDHAEDACRAALAIQEALKRYSRNLQNIYGIQFRLRIGINTGSVVVGSIGDDSRMDYTAIGDTTNLAARMETMAKPGKILISPNTYKKVRHQFEFKFLGEVEVKGKEKPLKVYELVKNMAVRPRLGQERRIYSVMVGREKELNRLELQVTKAIDGAGSVVNIIGEAGLGKSRLITELKHSNVMKRVNFLEGRAISAGRNLSFHPIINLLKHWARINKDESEASSLSKLESVIESVSRENANEIIPFIATLMSMKLTGRYAERVNGIEGEGLEKLIFKNVRDLISMATELTPLVIVMEDLHWADTSSIELLESLFRLSETQRVIFINIFRPHHRETGDRIIETIKEKLPVYYVEIKLEPLDERSSEILIDNMLNIRGLHYEFKGKILKRTEGNPFFIEEVVRSYIDEGAIIAKKGSFEVTEKIKTMVIPHTISDVLMARIDRLEDETRDIVKIASVIGKNFFHRIISEVAVSVDDINSKLIFLKEIQLVRENKRMGEVEYIFKHALTQEVAYNSILFSKRKELHKNVAQAIEKVFQDRLFEFFGVLAYHYNIAENLVKAEEYLIKAGEDALRASASNEALYYYQEALQLYLKKSGDSADPEKIAMLEKNIALALYNRGQFDEATEYFDKALNYYWGKIPKNGILEICQFLSAFLHFLVALHIPELKFKKIPTKRDNEISTLFFKKCEALIIIHPKRFIIESIYFQKHTTNFDLTKLKFGTESFMGASSLFSWSGLSFRLSKKILDFVQHKIDKNNDKQVMLYDLLETAHNFCAGSWSAIKSHDDNLVERSLGIGETWEASQYLFWHGLLNIYQGSWTNAESIVRKLNDIFETYDNDVALLLRQLLNTSLLVERRKINEALEEIEKGIDYGKESDQELSLLHMFSCHARVHIFTGDLETAGKSLDQADKIRRKAFTVPWQLSDFRIGKVEFNLFRLSDAIKKGNISDAASLRRQTYKSCRALLKESRKVAQNRAESYKLAGIYYWLINRQKSAIKWWGKAISEGERLGARVQLARTYLEIGKCIGGQKSTCGKVNNLSAEEYFNRAGMMFEEMNLQGDLDEMDLATCAPETWVPA